MCDPAKTLLNEERETRTSSRSAPTPADALVLLERDRQAHLRELDELRAALMEKPETDIEEADAIVPEQSTDMGLIQQIEEHLAEIDRAIKAVRAGTYGICERCGQRIDPERLWILPETRLCVQCKSELEKAGHHCAKRS